MNTNDRRRKNLLWPKRQFASFGPRCARGGSFVATGGVAGVVFVVVGVGVDGMGSWEERGESGERRCRCR